MADLDPSAQPRVPSLPALVEAMPAHPASSDTPASCESAIFTRERQVSFLHALAATGAVRSAAARCGVSHQTAYRARLGDAVFARGWNAALLAARAHAEEVLAVRAITACPERLPWQAVEGGWRRR